MPTKDRSRSPVINFQQVMENRRKIDSLTFRYENRTGFYLIGDKQVPLEKVKLMYPTEFITKSYKNRLDSRQV